MYESNDLRGKQSTGRPMSSKTWVGLTFSHLVLGSSPGWWAPTVATYYLSRMVEHPKSKSTIPSLRGHGPSQFPNHYQYFCGFEFLH